MKDPLIDEKILSKTAETSFWNSLSILRNENHISADEYHIILFLLSAYKDNLINDELLSDTENINETIIHRLGSYEGKYSKEYASITEFCEPDLRKLSKDNLLSILRLISDIDRDMLTKNFASWFDQILYRISQSQGRIGGEFIQPLEITRLMLAIAKLDKGAKVYNPFAGLASFGVFLEPGQEYLGQVIFQKSWALGVLRLMAHEKVGTLSYVAEDSTSSWPDESKRFDLIISTPPLNFNIGNQYRNDTSGIRTFEQFLLDRGIKSLKRDGKLITLMPMGLLFRRSRWELQLRKSLIDQDLLDTIIALPAGLFSYTGIPLMILVINGKKDYPGKVRFIKADHYVEAKGRLQKVLNDVELLHLIESGQEDEESMRIVDNSVIRARDYNLSVPRYFQKEIIPKEGESLVKLKDLLEEVNRIRPTLPQHGKFVRIGDLKDDQVDFNLNDTELEESEVNRPDIYQITESCLLLASRWRTLKPTYFQYSGTPVYATRDVLAFKVDDSVVDHRYLIKELHSDYVLEQLDSYRIGVTVPLLKKEDLLKVTIKLPNINEQKAIVKTLHELSDKIRILQEEKNDIILGESSSHYKSASSLKHALGTPLVNIGSSVRNIETALSRIYPDWMELKLSETRNIAIKDSFDSIYKNLESIHSLLRKNVDRLDLSNYPLTEIDFMAFFKSYVQSVKAAQKTSVTITLDIHPDIKSQLENKVRAQANAELLKVALDAIVENAVKHAFTDESKKYKLEFRLSIVFATTADKTVKTSVLKEYSYIKVEVANNGKPFPEKYSLDKLTTLHSFAGETGNTGQGGYDLNEIIKYHNKGASTLELITDDVTSAFTTTYSFLIPISK